MLRKRDIWPQISVGWMCLGTLGILFGLVRCWKVLGVDVQEPVVVFVANFQILARNDFKPFEKADFWTLVGSKK